MTWWQIALIAVGWLLALGSVVILCLSAAQGDRENAKRLAYQRRNGLCPQCLDVPEIKACGRCGRGFEDDDAA